MRRWFWTLALLAVALPMRVWAAVDLVPFSGCPGTAQEGGGLISAPQGKPLALDTNQAFGKLALYATNWAAVLAPRGWKCVDLESAQASVMYIWPRGGVGDPLNGPIVSVTQYTALGSFDIDKTYFPALFARLDTAAIPTKALRRYPRDVIVPGGARWFSYSTMAGVAGLGDASGQAELPSFGAVAHSLGSAKSLAGVVWLNVRLPENLSAARPVILKYFEHCMPDDNTMDCETGGAMLQAGAEFDGD